MVDREIERCVYRKNVAKGGGGYQVLLALATPGRHPFGLEGLYSDTW